MEVKERIMNEATRMFYDQGIRAVRMDDIAAACGISKRTLYEHFSDREDLIRQCLRYQVEKYESVAMEKISAAENVIDEFWLMFSSGGDFREGNKRVVRDLMKFYPTIFNDFISKHQHKVEERNRERFECGIEQGLIIKEIDSTLMSRLLTNYMYGLKRDYESHDFYSDKNNLPDERSLQIATMLFLRGISTEKGRVYMDKNILHIE